MTRSPSAGQAPSYLNGVSCPATGSCVAVGYWTTSQGADSHTLVETWDGTAWTVTPSPDTAAHANVLNGVSCAPDGPCTAVGSAEGGSTGFRTLIIGSG